MTRPARAWWRRLSAKHASPWSHELRVWIAARDCDREERLIGPELPPGHPHRASWSLLDRQEDPALRHFRLVPHAGEVPHIVDLLPHH